MLNVATRQKYLKALGFYTGKVDGITGDKTRAAYLALQKKYFTREKDVDGVYGNNTEILLKSAYNVSFCTKNFELEEFKCKCGKYCTGYPVVIDAQLLRNLQTLRDKYGAITITSALRCEKHNSLVGGTSGSRHKRGKAADIKCFVSKIETGRKAIMALWKTLPKQRYTYCNIGGSYPQMGSSVHIDVV